MIVSQWDKYHVRLGVGNLYSHTLPWWARWRLKYPASRLFTQSFIRVFPGFFLLEVKTIFLIFPSKYIYTSSFLIKHVQWPVFRSKLLCMQQLNVYPRQSSSTHPHPFYATVNRVRQWLVAYSVPIRCLNQHWLIVNQSWLICQWGP